MQGRTPDEDAIARAKPTLAAHLDILDRALSSTAYLAGDTVSLADLFLAPIVFYLSNTPEGRELSPARSAVQGWHENIAASQSYSKVNTPIWWGPVATCEGRLSASASSPAPRTVRRALPTVLRGAPKGPFLPCLRPAEALWICYP